jgi:hypothetical protein
MEMYRNLDITDFWHNGILFYRFLEIQMCSINILADTLNKNCLKISSIKGKKREGKLNYYVNF